MKWHKITEKPKRKCKVLTYSPDLECVSKYRIIDSEMLRYTVWCITHWAYMEKPGDDQNEDKRKE